MKLLVIAALIAVSAANRLEHLEQQQQLRTYLPPEQGSSNGYYYGSNGQRPFGAIAGAYGTDGPGFNARASFPGTSNRYLPPNYGSSASRSADVPDFAGSIHGFGAQNIPSQQYSQQPAINRYGNQKSFGVQSRFQSQPSAVNRQYLAPSQNYPQQPFDEQTGYHY